MEMLANVKRHMAAQPPAVWEQGPLVQVVLQFPCGSRLHSRVHGGELFYALAGHLPSPTLLLTPASLPSPSGSPAAKLTSDRGPRFTSSAWSAFCCSHSIEHITTTAYHPQSNGMVELIHWQLKVAQVARQSSTSCPVSVARLKPLLASGPFEPALPRRHGRPPAAHRQRGRPKKDPPPSPPEACLRHGRSAGLNPVVSDTQGLGVM